MEATLLVTPEQLQSASTTFASKATEVKNLHDEMISSVNSLCSSWEGKASETYKTKFNALKTSMDALNSMIMKHSNDLNTIAERYITAEEGATNLADEMPQSSLT
ncbi:MAG: WXG100 family type VII secretion target [Lachnospiraceae bacterium]|nr:WXG100 family type VII secretion target [Lachnospiraceae bacterium]